MLRQISILGVSRYLYLDLGTQFYIIFEEVSGRRAVWDECGRAIFVLVDHSA